MLQTIQATIHQNIVELFASAAVDEMAGDVTAYQKKLETIAAIAEALGLPTELTTATLKLLPDSASE